MIEIKTHRLHHRHHSSDSPYFYQKANNIYDRNQSCMSEATLRCLSQQNDAITVVGEDENEHGKSYFSSWLTDMDELYSKYSFAVILENKGNTARDHLANERTYLAWFRTSLSLITLGIGIIQVYHVSGAHHKRIGRALGLVFIMASILFLYFGNVRYFHAQWALQHGNFPSSRGVVTWASFCILFLFVGMFTVMLVETIKS